MKNFAIKLATFVASALATVAAFAQDCAHIVNAHVMSYLAHTGGVLFLTNLPTMEDFNRRRATDPNQSEIIRQRFYDSQLYPAAGVAQLSFFSLPIGQGITSAPGAVVGSAKTIQDTNLEMGNTLPSGKSFMIESIEFLFLPGTSAVANTFTMALPSNWNAVAAATLSNAMNDTYSFYNSGLVSLNILSKPYLTEMTQAFPPKVAFSISGAIATNSATTAEAAALYGKQSGRAYYLQPEISLQSAVNFSVAINYPAAVATPSTNNGRVICFLDGYFARAAQ